MLKYVIKDIVGQEACVQFLKMTAFTKTEDESYNEDSDSEKTCEVEVLYDNSRRTILVCYESEYERFIKAEDKFQKWYLDFISKNPSFERNRFDMAMLEQTIEKTIASSSQSVLDINEEMKKGLVELYKEMSLNVTETKNDFQVKSEKQMEMIGNQLLSLGSIIKNVEIAANAINQFVPQDSENLKTEIEIEVEQTNKEISSV